MITTTWISIPALILAIGFRTYTSVRFYQPYRNGIIPIGGRISLAKLSRARAYAKTGQAKALLTRYRRWYVLYLALFYAAIAIFLAGAFKSSTPILK